jgi:hypothetical protein
LLEESTHWISPNLKKNVQVSGEVCLLGEMSNRDGRGPPAQYASAVRYRLKLNRPKADSQGRSRISSGYSLPHCMQIASAHGAQAFKKKGAARAPL